MSKFIIYCKSNLLRSFSQIILPAALLALSISAQVKTDVSTQLLTSNQPIERELKGDEGHSYNIALDSNQYLNLVVEQKGIDVVLRLFGPEDKLLMEVDSPNGSKGPELLSFISESGRNYRLEVRSLEKTAAAGRYEVKIVVLRLASERDTHFVAANKAFAEAEMSMKQGTAEALQSAIKKFEESFILYQATEEQGKAGRALNAIGKIYYFLGNKQKALDYWTKAHPLRKAAGDNLGEAQTLYNIAFTYAELSKLQKALEFYQQSLQPRRLFGDKDGEQSTLNNIGIIYFNLGENQKALDYYAQALAITKITENKNDESAVVNNIGAVYERLGEYQKTLEYYNQALLLCKTIENKECEVVKLTNIGLVHAQLGENQKALDYYLKVLPISKAIEDKFIESLTLTSIGDLNYSLGENQKALDYYGQAITVSKTVNYKRAEAKALTGIALTYAKLGENQKALDYLIQALPLRRSASDKRGEAGTLSSFGRVYSNLGERQKAFEYFSRALILQKTLKDRLGEADTLNGLQKLWASAGEPRLAIFYGKQAINKYQELRHGIQQLDKELQQTYLKKIEGVYRQLADMLISQDRIAEAEQVLAMLKEKEYFDYLRRDDQVAKELLGKLSLTPAEQEAFQDYNEIADNLTLIGKELGELQAESQKYEIGKFPKQARLDELERQISDANRVFNTFLDELKIKFTENDKRVASVESGMQALLKELNQPRTVIISTIVDEDRLNLIVTTENAQRAHSVEIKSNDLNHLVFDFREAVKNPSVDPRPAGKKLYDVLFPIGLQKDLENIKADTIIWSLDGTLRYVPVAALSPDGKNYLTQQYATAVITLASRDKLNVSTANRAKWTALGVGVSKKFEEFPALKAVPEELCNVINDKGNKAYCSALPGSKNGVMTGHILSDENFTLDNFKANLGRFPIVHIASHFSLNVGNESDSYLLLGGIDETKRKLNLSALRSDFAAKFVGVELLTLSACNTAMTAGNKSNGLEIEGFGALAQKQGAKAVLATLWAVADPSTRDLMTEFYRILKTGAKIGKAEALREAQIALLTGKYGGSAKYESRNADVINLVDQNKKPPTFIKDSNAPYSHPYYWSPFILIGNWR